MKLWLGLFVLFIALTISVVAGYFSVTGLVALFAAAPIAVMVMGGTLEVAKLVASGWLKFNWDNRNTNRWLKWSLVGFIVNLMLITSIGIYGQLMSANLEQNAPAANIAVQTEQLEIQVAQRTGENERLQQRLGQIDKNISVFLENDQASRGLNASQSLQRERDKLSAQLEANNQKINELQEKLTPLKMESNKVEAKLGPFKNFAELLGLPENSAVQLVIGLIMVSFDPLAVALLLAALQTLREHTNRRKAKEPIVLPEPIMAPAQPVIWETVEETEEKEEPVVEEPAVEEPAVEEDLEEAFDDADEFATDEELVAWRNRVMADIENGGPAVEDDSEVEDISRLAGLRPEAEREFIAEAIPVLDDHVEDYLDQQPVDHKEVDRDTLISILERNPGILNEIEEFVEEEVVEELSDREKLLDLLEKNPAIISDMAGIIASQIASDAKPKGDSWLND
jgi:chaperonin cofactor prefoldin